LKTNPLHKSLNYFEKYHFLDLQISQKPANNLNMCIVIPCFNEPELIKSLESIKNCTLSEKSVEIIIVINSGTETEIEIIEKNRKTYLETQNWIKKNNTEKLNFFVLNIENLPQKFAGVGLARKIGMDEAYSRLYSVGNENGIIVGFDADSTCQENYLCQIEQHFETNPPSNGVSIYFEHPTQGAEYEQDIYENITKYELYLRYYKQALQFADFPFAFHTIGSSFAVRAKIYAKQGGMNRRKAGEDFYFLQKIIPLGNYNELNTTTVYPSPRSSDRVPFGTGAAIQKMLLQPQNDYLTYHLQAFLDLKTFFIHKNIFFEKNYENAKEGLIQKQISPIILFFLNENNFEEDLKKIIQNSPSLKTFNNRFFQWFDAFRVLKFLNFSHENHYKKESIKMQASNLLQIAYNYLTCTLSHFDLLFAYRKIDKGIFETEEINFLEF